MKKLKFFLKDRAIVAQVIEMVRGLPLGVHEVIIQKAGDLRTLEQNAHMWGILGNLAKQTDWHGIKLTSEEWKDVITACLKSQKTVPNYDRTGFVVIGARTSKMKVGEMRDVIDFAYSVGNEKGVKWSASKAETERLFPVKGAA